MKQKAMSTQYIQQHTNTVIQYRYEYTSDKQVVGFW